MSQTTDGLGGRIPLAQPAHLSGSQQSLYKTISETSVPWATASGFVARIDDGRLVGPFNTLLESPELGDAFLQFQSAEQKMTSLSEPVRQVVILTVGSVWKASYELYAHSAVARTAGLSEDAVQLLVRGEPHQVSRQKKQQHRSLQRNWPPNALSHSKASRRRELHLGCEGSSTSSSLLAATKPFVLC